MQQAGAVNPDSTTSGKSLPPESERYVINLSASTTPVGLVPPTHPQLRAYSFFVSRKLENGRERFRLHMGYFASLDEAEHMLELVREVYPAAWAGTAPGQRLQVRLPKSNQPAQPVAAPLPAPPVAPVVACVVPVHADGAAPQATTTPPATTPPVAEAAETFNRIRATIDALSEGTGATLDSTGNTVIAPGVAELRASNADTAATLSGLKALELLEGAEREHLQAPAATLAPAPAPAAAPAPRAVKLAPEARGEVPVYAVQLLWSVQAIDMAAVPRLAIFGAYRLYGAEGNRDGRRWYGLRLGFFADTVSAQQVASYVRSEFPSVAVVPVSVGERDRVSRKEARPLPATKQQPRDHGMQFIDDVSTDTATSGSQPALVVPEGGAISEEDAEAAWVAAAAAAVQGPAPRKGANGNAQGAHKAPTGKRVKVRAASRAGQGTRTPPQDLEATLEALGASTLSLEDGRRKGRNTPDEVASRRDPSADGPSRFGKLLDRLARTFGTP